MCSYLSILFGYFSADRTYMCLYINLRILLRIVCAFANRQRKSTLSSLFVTQFTTTFIRSRLVLTKQTNDYKTEQVYAEHYAHFKPNNDWTFSYQQNLNRFAMTGFKGISKTKQSFSQIFCIEPIKVLLYIDMSLSSTKTTFHTIVRDQEIASNFQSFCK